MTDNLRWKTSRGGTEYIVKRERQARREMSFGGARLRELPAEAPRDFKITQYLNMLTQAA